MGQIVPAGQFNPSSLTADDLYISILQPPGYVTGVPTDVIGVVGTASWGPVEVPVHLSSPYDALTSFGPISAASLTDVHDLATDLAIAFGQASSQASIEGFGVRVTDGTDTAASAPIPGAASSASITTTFSGTILNGDTCTLTFTSSALTGSPVAVQITVITGDSLTTIAARMVAAINANAAIAAVGGYATNTGAVLSFYQPTALSPQMTVGQTSGTDVTLTQGTGAAVTAGLTLSGIYTGVLGAGISCNVVAGAATNTFTLQLGMPSIGAAENYPNIAGGTGFWARAVAAINNGLSGIRGPSQICKASAGNIAVGAPIVQSTNLTGGSDGRAAVTTAILLGSQNVTPNTGIWQLNNVSPAVGVSWMAGCTDSTAWASLLSYAQTSGSAVLAAFPTGTSTSSALTLIQSNGVHDPSFAYVKDWVYFFDSINNTTRLVPPYAFIGGTIATLPPESNPGNKTVNLCLGTERYSLTGAQPYGLSEIGQLASAGVMFIANPIPAGTEFGIREGQTTSLNAATQGIEWWRMTIFLARSFNQTMGQFVDENQSRQPNDPLRNAITNQSNNFLASLGARIDGYSTICTLNTSPTASPGNGVNTPVSIAQHYLYVMWKVTYLSNVRFLIGTLQGGTTVVTVGSTPGQSLQN